MPRKLTPVGKAAFIYRTMIRPYGFLIFSILTALFLASCATRKEAPVKLERANVLPLELNDRFQFRKIKLMFFDPDQAGEVVTRSEPLAFERRRMEWGAITQWDRQQRFGNYFSFFWRTSERADVTVRLEFRQAALGNTVLAQELYYPAARGSFHSEFKVVGDDYYEFGRVTMWRALLIVDGRIVALRQSFLWK